MAAVVLAGGVAVAAVQFDPDTGKGFTGRADVRQAFGWTGAELREKACGLSFVHVDGVYYPVTCGNGSRSESVTPHTVVEKVVDHRVRRSGEAVRGFDLRGYAGQTSSTSLYQQEGQRCRGSDSDGEFGGVWGPVETTSKVRGLFVRYRSQERPLG